MIDYYAWLGEAVAKLGDQNTPERRRNIYAVARNLISARLKGHDDVILNRELDAFDSACNRIEVDNGGVKHNRTIRQMIKLDVTKLVRRWNFLQRISLIAMFFAFHGLALSVLAALSYVFLPESREEIDYSSVAGQTIIIVMALYVARETWICGTMISKSYLRRLRVMYRLLTGFYSLFFAFVLVIFGLGLSMSEPTNRASVEQTIAIGSLLGVGTLIAIWLSLLSLRQIKILLHGTVEEAGLSLEKLQEFIEYAQTDAPAEARWIFRLDRPIGLVWSIGGAALFLLGAGLYDFAASYALEHLGSHSNSSSPGGLGNVGTIIEILGAFCILKGRSYFVPTAEAILALDRRAPILYLRSFSDEKPNYREMIGGWQFVDRSLEMKLAKHFNLFGPFVAIGLGRDKLPKLGALRLIRSEQDWQDEVASLMVKAQTIVAAVGVTRWIQWELSEIVARGYVNKSVFFFPVQSRFGSTRRRAVQHTQLTEVLEKIMPLEHKFHVCGLKKNELMLACVALQDCTTIVTCRKPTSNGQFLAAAIAHYILMSNGGRPLDGSSS